MLEDFAKLKLALDEVAKIDPNELNAFISKNPDFVTQVKQLRQHLVTTQNSKFVAKE